MSDEGAGHDQEQLAIEVRAAVRRSAPRKRRAIAARLPVARIVVDKGLSHLDRFFDYAVPEALDEAAQPGVRVRVRFGARVVGGRRQGGDLIDGVLVERLEASDYPGPLAPLERVLSPEPVFPPYMLDLARAVADRYAGTLADVIQLALPPRHARAEAEPAGEALPGPGAPEPGTWERYEGGVALLEELAGGAAPRIVWTALPGPSWAGELALLAAAVLASGRGALFVLPDGRDVAAVDAALGEVLGQGRHVALTADLGPEERYRRWLSVRRGVVRAVVGTRAAMFAPVADLGLALVWCDGDATHSEPHAPHPHVREVLAMRAMREGAGFVVGGRATSVEAAQFVRSGWARPVEAARAVVRACAPVVRTVGGDFDLARDEAARVARLPSAAWQVARRGLERGPVLVQVPRRGYVPRMACDRCREPARCGRCSGPLGLRGQGGGALVCGWCGRPEVGWRCGVCGGSGLRASVVGAGRTAEELGRAFPRVPVRTSGGDAVVGSVPGVPSLVIATPGAEPVAEGGYAAALLLDGWVMLGRPDLRSGEETLRRWVDAASLVRPVGEGGEVVVVAEAGLRAVQALVRWGPQDFALRELEDRAALGFPPVSRMASVTGSPGAVAEVLSLVELPEGADVLGPVPVAPVVQRRRDEGQARRGVSRSAAARARIVRVEGEGDAGLWSGAGGGAVPERGVDERRERVLLRVSPGQGAELAAALKRVQAVRLARRAVEPVWVRVDPVDIG